MSRESPFCTPTDGLDGDTHNGPMSREFPIGLTVPNQ